MKKLFILSLFIALTSFSIKSDTTYVYICLGPQSTKYHFNENCKGLKTCSTRIVKVTIDEAYDMKRTLCGYEKD